MTPFTSPKYDHLGRRVQKRVVEGTPTAEVEVSNRRYVYDGWNLVAEYAVNTTTSLLGLVRSYTWGLDIATDLTKAGGVGALVQIADHTTGKTYLPSYDGNGNVVALFDADAS